MNYLKLSILFLMLFSVSAFAKSEGHIITASSTKSSLSFYKDYSDDYKAAFSATVGYDYAFTQGFMLGADFGASIYPNGNNWSLAIGPGYNFNKQDIENSYFSAVKVGAFLSHYNSYTNTFAFMTVKGGKRFKLMEHVSYVPELSVEKFFGPNSNDPTFTFEIFSIAIIF